MKNIHRNCYASLRAVPVGRKPVNAMCKRRNGHGWGAVSYASEDGATISLATGRP